jgi:predicted nucleotidyltransferase
MNIVGLITEYNPFHNGHRLHLRKSETLTDAGAVVVVMSGNFLQRGEPALFNKWARTEMALAGGADMVIELPAAFATRSARQFAAGAVRILDATGIVTHLCFGSELGEIEPLQRLAAIIGEEPAELKKNIKKHLHTGVTLPVAESRALAEYAAAAENVILTSDLTVLNKPNNILGIEYLRALAEINSSVKPITISRVAAGYHDEHFSPSGIASATGIRKTLEKIGGRTTEISPVVPSETLSIMNKETSSGRGPVFPEFMMSLLQYRLRTIPKDYLAAVLDVGEGLEHRIVRATKDSHSLSELIDNIKTKRYTRTRIQRVLTYIFLGYNKTMANHFDDTGPGYIRILGMSEKGRGLVRKMKKAASLPVITRVAPFIKTGAAAREMLNLDISATDIYTLLYPQANQRCTGLDYRVMPLMVK